MWNGLIWLKCGGAWHCRLWCGLAWLDPVWQGRVQVRQGMAWSAQVRFATVA